jgi:hypothetical protein
MRARNIPTRGGSRVAEESDHLVGLEATVLPEPNPADPERLRVELVALFDSGKRISTEGVAGGLFVTRDTLGSPTSSTPVSDIAAELESHVRRSVSGDLTPPEWRFRRLIDALASHGIATSADELERLPFGVDLRLW